MTKSADSKRSSITQMRLIAILTYPFLNMLLIYQRHVLFGWPSIHAWLSNLGALSMVAPKSLTCSLGGISCPLMLRHNSFFLLRLRSIIWNFDRLPLIPLTVYNSNNPCRSLSSLIVTESVFVSPE